MGNENSILDLFNEEEINKFDSIFDNETKKINHKSYNNNLKNFTLNEESNGNSSEMITNIKSGRNMQRFSRSPDTNSNLLTEEQKNNNKIYNKNDLLIQRYRSPQNKMNKGKETLQIEKPVGESECCASCT